MLPVLNTIKGNLHHHRICTCIHDVYLNFIQLIYSTSTILREQPILSDLQDAATIRKCDKKPQTVNFATADASREASTAIAQEAV